MYRRALSALSIQGHAHGLLRYSTSLPAADLPRPLAPGHGTVMTMPKAPAVELEVADERLVQIGLDFKLHKLEVGPDTLVTLTTEQARRYYGQLMTIRRLEAASAQLYKERFVRGFCHLSTGQEACTVGLCAALRKQDNVVGGYRIHGLAHLMGVTAKSVLAELAGKAIGCSKGKGGSMHMYAPNFYGGNGIVGAQVAIGAGIALANKQRGNDAVCFALYGDGAANQGQIFECFNMAQLWKLPVVFVCENNNYGMGTISWRASSNTQYYTRGDFLPGIWADGQDVLAVRSAANFAINHAQRRGPLVLELCTYRYEGHSMSDPGTSCRSRMEVQQMRQRQDPIERFRNVCLDTSLLSGSEMTAIDQQVRDEIDQAVVAAKSSTELPISHLSTDVYSGSFPSKVRGVLGYNLEHTLSRTDTCRK